jgi:tripartite-type tricarboxylate transporter receptor subunit TctC
VKRLSIIAICLVTLMMGIMSGCSTPAPTATGTTAPTATSTATAAAFVPNKFVSFIVSNAPGGGYDLYTRGILAVMGNKYLNQPLIVQNVSGAGGVAGTVQLYRSKPDGYTLGLMDVERRVMDTITGAAKDFDMSKFTYIATCNKQSPCMCIAGKSPWNTVQDVIKASQTDILNISTTSVGGAEALFPVLMGLNKYSYVTGYAGTAENVLAVVKGDAQMSEFSDSSALPYIKSGDIKCPVFFGSQPSRVFEAAGIKVPTSIDVGLPKLADIGSVRIFTGPPGLPPEIAKYWENMLMKVMADPDLIKWSQTSNNPIDAYGSADSAKLEQGIFTNYNQYKDILLKYAS